MKNRQPDRNRSTNGPTEPNQRPPERREEPTENAVKGPAVISEANVRERERDDRRADRDHD